MQDESQQPCADCGPPVPGVKPPPIVLEVSGIFGTKFADKARNISPHRLSGLPPFQMFCAERGIDSKVMIQIPGAVDEYCTWHRQKGLWPKETPFGDLVDG